MRNQLRLSGRFREELFPLPLLLLLCSMGLFTLVATRPQLIRRSLALVLERFICPPTLPREQKYTSFVYPHLNIYVDTRGRLILLLLLLLVSSGENREGSQSSPLVSSTNMRW